MSPHAAPQAFVDNYIKLLPEADSTEFQKVLEMKVSEGHSMTLLFLKTAFLMFVSVLAINKTIVFFNKIWNSKR